MYQKKHIKIWSFIAWGIAILLVGYIVTHFSAWQRSADIFPALNKTMLSWRKDKLSENIQKAIGTSNAYALLQEGNYTKALTYITGEDSQSYYNRGVIKTLIAYDQASQREFSWLREATTLVDEAKNDFLLAKQLQTNGDLTAYISTNLQTAEELDIVIWAKTCYVIADGIIQNISWLQKMIDTTKDLLIREQQLLQKNTSIIPRDCLNQWQDTIATSTRNIQTLRDTLAGQEKIQQEHFTQKRINPTLCLGEQNPEVMDNFVSTKKMIENFVEQHTQSSAIRELQDKEGIQELCQTTKNDSQINQSIQSTIDKLLASLQENNKLGTWNFQPATNTPQYIPLNASDQKLLENIDKKNKIWIRQIQRLKTDPKYQGLEYIQTLFKEFYGNTGDFQQ